MRTGGQDTRETKTEEQNMQRALLAYGHPEDADKKRIPSNKSVR